MPALKRTDPIAAELFAGWKIKALAANGATLAIETFESETDARFAWERDCKHARQNGGTYELVNNNQRVLRFMSACPTE